MTGKENEDIPNSCLLAIFFIMHPFLGNEKSAVDVIFLTHFGNVFITERSCALGHFPHFEDNSVAVREGCLCGLWVASSGRTGE